MNPNRNEWLEMWNSIKIIEGLASALQLSPDSLNKRTGKAVAIQVNKIKKQIESVIGQME